MLEVAEATTFVAKFLTKSILWLSVCLRVSWVLICAGNAFQGGRGGEQAWRASLLVPCWKLGIRLGHG